MKLKITFNNPLINDINLDRLVQNLPFLCYDFKKGLTQMNENKTNINWLVLIYQQHFLEILIKQGFARFKILHFYIKRIKILCKNNNKWSKITYQMWGGISSQHFI